MPQGLMGQRRQKGPRAATCHLWQLGRIEWAHQWDTETQFPLTDQELLHSQCERGCVGVQVAGGKHYRPPPKPEKMDARPCPPKIGVMYQTQAKPLPGMQVSPSTQEPHNIPWAPPPEDHISGIYEGVHMRTEFSRNQTNLFMSTWCQHSIHTLIRWDLPKSINPWQGGVVPHRKERLHCLGDEDHHKGQLHSRCRGKPTGSDLCNDNNFIMAYDRMNHLVDDVRQHQQGKRLPFLEEAKPCGPG